MKLSSSFIRKGFTDIDVDKEVVLCYTFYMTNFDRVVMTALLKNNLKVLQNNGVVRKDLRVDDTLVEMLWKNFSYRKNEDNSFSLVQR
jgi:hypothetical protein